MRCAGGGEAKGEVKVEEGEGKAWWFFGAPVFKSTEVGGEHWVEGKLVTHLPCRDIVAKDLYYVGVVADREGIIGISVKVRFFFGSGLLMPMYLTERTDRDLMDCIILFTM